MKKIYFVILFLFSQQVFSQYLSSGIGRWRLGVNVGGLCQKADIKHDVYNFGFGATLEYAAYQKQSSFFGFSLRGRFLNGKTTGYNTLPHEGAISNNAINGVADTTFNYSNSPLYLNNRTKLNEFSLEGMLKWNKLYQNKGILFYLYFGAGFTNYKVETDQKDFTNSPYDYSFLLSPNPSVDEIKVLQDGEFETELINSDYKTMVFTPSFGVGLGFRLVPGLDFALEHKVSLPQTDLFDGQATDNGDPGFIQDMYHYTSLGLIFSIVNYVEPTTYTPPVEPVEPTPVTPVTTAPVRPTILLTQPTGTSFNSPNCKTEVVAKIKNVRHQGDITFYQNGTKVPSYKYFYSKPTFKCKVDLVDGENSFQIIAKNATYTETKTFSLSCNNEQSINICHKNNDGTSNNITIKESQWATHASHGDTKGNCIDKQITICHNLPGQGGKTQTISIAESQWEIHKSHGDYLGECSTKKMITICHYNTEMTIDEKDWAAHAAHGDTKGNCPPPQVKLITICHVPPTGNKRVTMSIPENEWLVHQAHGDIKGTCPSVEPTTTICHKNPNGTKSTMTIPEFRWNEHFSHGDTKGNCPEPTFIICHKDPATGKKQNISITESLWAQHAAHGDTKGKCPVVENQITICHNIPGQPGKTQTMTIPESKWGIHKSHGDVKGACPEPVKYIQICHKYRNTTTNMTIKESEWLLHAAHGDTKGNCPIIQNTNTLKICHYPNGPNSTPQSMMINPNDWPVHSAHGDYKGDCNRSNTNNNEGGNEAKMKICHYPPGNNNPESIEIPISEWPTHAAHGDSKGFCSTSTGSGNNNPKFDICHTPPGGGAPETIQVTELEWKMHLSHGDTKGACSNSGSSGSTGGNGDPANNRNIKICHNIPGKPGQTQTITIPESEWAAHKLHGDVQGPCVNNTGSGGGNSSNDDSKFDICHTPPGGGTATTIKVTEKEWIIHKLHGDTKGTCSNSRDTKIKGGKKVVKPGKKGKSGGNTLKGRGK